MSGNRLIRRSAKQWPVKTVIFVIELYRTWISPIRLPSCRFYPTCSAYAIEALEEWGFIAGGWLSIVRLIKCGPWHKPGYDPIPERHRAGSEVPDCQSSDPSGELDDHHHSVRL